MMLEELTLFNASTAAATLPPTLKAAYLAWQPKEGRESRLGRLTAGIAADFQAAAGIASNPIVVEKPAAVPVRSVRHCEAVLWYTLALECGVAAEQYRPGWQDAEVWLRQLYVTLRQGAGANGEPGTPRYDGVAGAVGGTYVAALPGNTAPSRGVVVRPINYGGSGRPGRMTLY